MDKKLKDYITQGFSNLPPPAKRVFLMILKREPERVANMVADNLEIWAMEMLMGEERPWILAVYTCPDREEVQEIVEHLKKYFSASLQLIV